MKKKPMILTCISLVVAISFFVFWFPRDKTPVYVNYASSIRDQYLKHLRKEYNVKCDGFGGSFLYNVKQISLALSSNESDVNIEKAREQHVNFTEEFIRRINGDERIRPYLDHYPFSPEGVSIRIAFEASLHGEDVTYVFYSKGNVVYARPDVETGLLESFFEEPYEEAVRIVKEQGKLRGEG